MADASRNRCSSLGRTRGDLSLTFTKATFPESTSRRNCRSEIPNVSAAWSNVIKASNLPRIGPVAVTPSRSVSRVVVVFMAPSSASWCARATARPSRICGRLAPLFTVAAVQLQPASTSLQILQPLPRFVGRQTQYPNEFVGCASRCKRSDEIQRVTNLPKSGGYCV